MSDAPNPRGPLPPPPPLSERMPSGSPLLQIPVVSDPEPPPIAQPPLSPPPPPPKPAGLDSAPPLLKPSATPPSDVAAKVQQGAELAKAETIATLRVMKDTVSRLFAFGRSGLEQRQLAQRLVEAQEALGQKLERAGLGDSNLRTQLEQLVERRKSVEAAKGPVKVLDAERRGLYLRLAEPYLQAIPPPAGLEAEHRDLLKLQQELQDTRARFGEQRTTLLPADGRDRMRALAGFGATALIMLIGVWMVWASGRSSFRSVRRTGPVIRPPSPADPTILPVMPPSKPKEKDSSRGKPSEPIKPAPAKPSQPVKQERWEEANDYFPRRKVVATLVDDQPHGEVKFYDAKDRLIGVEHYDHGVLEGTRVCNYPSGKKFAETPFKKGVAHGTSKTWFENGKLAASVEFMNGQITGKSITYFSNGNECVIAEVVDGVRHGVSTHFRPDGRAFAAVEWQNGAEVNRNVVLEVRQPDLAKIEERNSFSTLLKDWWP